MQQDKPVMLLQKDKHVRLMLGEGEQGGMVCAYGPEPGRAGIATLSGGPVTGGISLGAAVRRP